MIAIRSKKDEAPPDWKDSQTAASEVWKNPLFTNADNLLIADGAIAWRDEVIANLRQQLKEAKKDSELLDFLGSLGRMELRKLPGSMYKTSDDTKMFAPYSLSGSGYAFIPRQDLRETIRDAKKTMARNPAPK